MKKLFYMISTVALMASFASCNKIEQGNAPADNTPADGLTTLTVSATVPQTKTNLSNDVVRWSSNDVITIMSEGVESVRSSAVETAAPTHDFTVEGWPSGVVPQYAAFTGPYQKESPENYENYKPVWNNDGTIQMIVRSKQPIYNEDSFSKTANISIGELVETDGGYSTEMKNVCGLIKFTLSSPTKQVVIEDVNGAAMTGKVNVRMTDGIPVATRAGESGKITVTSKLKDSGEILAHNGGGTYYAVLIPGTYTPKITVTPVEGEEIVLTANSAVTIVRNEIMDFGTIDNINTGGEEGGDDPVTPEPTETLTIALSIADTPFNESLPGKSSNSKGPDKYTTKDGNYEFIICNTDDKYAKEGNYLRLTYTANKVGYIKFPSISEYKLTKVVITSGNAEDANGTGKSYKLYKEDPITNSSALQCGSVTINGYLDGEIMVSDPELGVGYYLAASGKNTQFSKLVLTYSK